VYSTTPAPSRRDRSQNEHQLSEKYKCTLRRALGVAAVTLSDHRLRSVVVFSEETAIKALRTARRISTGAGMLALTSAASESSTGVASRLDSACNWPTRLLSNASSFFRSCCSKNECIAETGKHCRIAFASGLSAGLRASSSQTMPPNVGKPGRRSGCGSSVSFGIAREIRVCAVDPVLSSASSFNRDRMREAAAYSVSSFFSMSTLPSKTSAKCASARRNASAAKLLRGALDIVSIPELPGTRRPMVCSMVARASSTSEPDFCHTNHK
jgi:hypothetical protein